jgi:signal transduction histidine kinase
MHPEESWSELLNIVAHDLKSPITAVKGYIELIQQAGTLNDKQQHFSERALVGLEHMAGLITKLLDIAWIDADRPPELTECNLEGLIQEAMAMLEQTAHQREITLHAEIDPNLGTIMADVRRMTQVVNNLLSNAIKYNRDGGAVYLKAQGGPDTIWLTVQDTGIGIAPEDQTHLFERFYRSKAGVEAKIEGNGLGLSIVKGVVERHQGRIWFETVPDEGTTFHVTLPRSPDTPPSNEDGEGQAPHMEVSHPGGESVEGSDFARHESVNEEIDAVDDDIQESDEVEASDLDEA